MVAEHGFDEICVCVCVCGRRIKDDLLVVATDNTSAFFLCVFICCRYFKVLMACRG